MGFFVVLLWLAALAIIPAWMLASYAMETVFLWTVLKKSGTPMPGRCAIPVYRYDLMGRSVGAKGVGVALAVCHGSIWAMGAAMCLTEWDVKLAAGVLVMAAVCAVLSEYLAWRIYTKAAREDRRLLFLLDILTLGLTRPAFLLSLRKRLEL